MGLKDTLLAKESKRLILLFMTPHGDAKWPTIAESNLKQLQKTVDHCKQLQKIRELIISARKDLFLTAEADAREGENAECRLIHDDCHRVFVFAIEQDPGWLDEMYKDACKDVSKGMYFSSVGKQKGGVGSSPPLKKEVTRLLN